MKATKVQISSDSLISVCDTDNRAIMRTRKPYLAKKVIDANEQFTQYIELIVKSGKI